MPPSSTKNYTSGDVVVVYFQHQEDKSQGEPRYIICLQDMQTEMVAVPLKGNLDHQRNHPGSFVIYSDSDEGKQMGLIKNSLVVTSRATIMPKIPGIIKGKCSEELLDRLDELLKGKLY